MRRLVIAAVLSAVAIAPQPAVADVTVHVTTAQDQITTDGVCSVREAVDVARGVSRPDCASGVPNGVVTIIVSPGCYRIFSPLVILPSANVGRVVIAGAGAGPAPL